MLVGDQTQQCRVTRVERCVAIQCQRGCATVGDADRSADAVVVRCSQSSGFERCWLVDCSDVLALYGVLLSRAGTVRGMIGIFLTPIVGTTSGVTVRGESLHALAVVGMSIVIVGAVMVSRPEPARLRPVALSEGLLEVGDQVGSGLDPD